MKSYFSKIILIQFFNIIFPFIFMKFLLKDKQSSLFTEVESLVTLGSFIYLATEFSFSLVSVLLLKGGKIFKRRLNYIFSNIVTLRLSLFILFLPLQIILISFLDIVSVEKSYLICFYPLAAVIDLGWFYLLTERYYIYFFYAVFIKNLIFLLFIYFFNENLEFWYLLGFVLIPLILNTIIFYRSKLKIKFKYISRKYIKSIFKKGYSIAVSDLIISSYTYLDVYLAVLLLPTIESLKYLIVRKLVKGATSLIGQLPKIILKKTVESASIQKKMNTFFLVIIFVLFILFNFLSGIIYNDFLKISNLEVNKISLLFSLLIIIGPLQNLYSQVYILKTGQSYIYMKSYLFGLIFFMSGIFILNNLEMLTVYIFIIIRLLSDISIFSFSYVSNKVLYNGK